MSDNPKTILVLGDSDPGMPRQGGADAWGERYQQTTRRFAAASVRVAQIW